MMGIMPPSLFTTFARLYLTPASGQVLPLPRDIGSALSSFVDSVKGAPVSSRQLETFQEEAQKLSYFILDEIAKGYEGAAQFVTDLKDMTEQVVRHSKKTAAELEGIIGSNNITMTELARRLEKEIRGADLGLKENVVLQLLECDADARAQLVAQVLDKVQTVYIDVLTEAGVSPGQAEDQYNEFAAKIKAISLIIGEFINKYPILSDIVMFAVKMLLVPEIPIFQVVLRLLGLGLQAPVGGVAVAWLRSRL